MRKKMRQGSLAEYVAEILKNAVYEKGEQLDVIVAEAPDLPGCVTQGESVEEAREPCGRHRGLADVRVAKRRRPAGGKWLSFGHHRGATEAAEC